jgi:Meckelin (Transmembrane protein 67)
MDPPMYIKDRSWMQRLLNRAPMAHLKDDKPIMFKDHWGAFNSTFLMGMDFDFLMLDVVIITFMERETQREVSVNSRVILAVLLAYIIDQLLFWLRGYLGRRNLSKHTLADEAFLL